MKKQSPKMTALVVSAIRNLREIQGSTPKEILHYIMSEYNAAKPTTDAAIERKLCTALKRGLDYGILKRVHNHYSLNTDPETIAPADDMLMGPMERSGRGCGSAMKKKRRRRARASARKGCKPRSSRRGRKRGGGGGKKRRRASKRGSCGPSRSSRRKSRGRRSRRGRKSRGGGGGHGKRRRGHRRARGRRSRRGKSSGKCATRHSGEDVDVLAKDPVETRHRDSLGGGGVGSGGYGYARDRERSHSRGRQQSRSRSPSPSHSRSSGSSDREGNEGGNRRDRQVE